MTVKEIITQEKPSLSFEVFPPKTADNFDKVKTATEQIALLKPSYMSVTYGAGGSTSKYTAEIAQNLKNNYGVTPLAHMTCVCSYPEDIHARLDALKSKGIENILALRGDIPAGESMENMHYKHASELVYEIKKFGGFCIGGACYPEGHPESENGEKDLYYLKQKADSGMEFLTTQMFFDNNILYNFLYRALKHKIDVPVIAGIMPVTSAVQIKRIMSISGTALPQRFVRIVDRFGDDPAAMKQAGIAYATEQIIDLLANGINAIHVYSMNKPDVAAAIKENLRHII